MISYLKGKVLIKKPSYIIIEAGGVGYQVFCNPSTTSKLKEDEEVSIYTHHHVKEDAQDLYGFLSLPELQLFKNVISISGVGPKSGLNVLAIASVEDIIRAILSEDPALLKSVSGIGTKTAERIVMELKSKISKLSKEITDKDIQAAPRDIEVIEALIGLGYSRREVVDIVRQIPNDITDISERIKAVLKLLGTQ